MFKDVVMDLCLGGELFDVVVNEGPLGEERARAVMRRLLEGVAYLHARGIVHRDLKPENILLGTGPDRWNVKIADFGLAKVAGDDGLKTYCGSPQYFAPEVICRKATVLALGRYGKSADMWSLGVILFILLTASPPFDSTELQAFILARKRRQAARGGGKRGAGSGDNLGSSFADEEFEIPFDEEVFSEISEPAKDMIRRLLMIDDSQRLAVEEALQHPWFQVEL